MNDMVILAAKAEIARKEVFNGIDHVVVPVIALVEGVLQSANSPSPELALASEFGKAPAGWNGRPVTINHPELRGQKVSANSPEVLETEQVGQLFNTVLDGKKLKTEAWINISRANELGGEIKENVDRLLKGDIVEVSTGLFSDVEKESGIHDGEKFNGIWRNVVPDHLAILDAGTIGACSVADGCGANRANSGRYISSINHESPFVPCENCTCSRKNESSPLASNGENPDDREDGKGTIFDRLKDLVSFKANKELSHNSVRNAINAVLASEEGFTFLVDIFAKHVIVEKEGTLFRRNFKITTSGKVKLDQEATPVRFEADFVDLRMNEEDIMDKDKFVTDLIANEGSGFEEGDKDWLLALEDGQLEKLTPKAATAQVDVKSEEFITAVKAEAEKVKANVGTETVVKKAEPQTLDDYINSAPDAMQEVLSSGVRAFNSRKDELTKQIKANEKNKFSDEDLKNMNMRALENLAALSVTEDYTMRGGPRLNEREDPNAIPAPEAVFDLTSRSLSNGAAKE